MGGIAFVNPVTGVWPFGFVATVAAGTPVPITVNVGSQRQKSPHLYANKCLQITITAPTTNTGAIYILKPGYTKTQTNGLIKKLLPGDPPLNLPEGFPFPGGLMPDDLWLDSDTSGEGAQVYGIRG